MCQGASGDLRSEQPGLSLTTQSCVSVTSHSHSQCLPVSAMCWHRSVLCWVNFIVTHLAVYLPILHFLTRRVIISVWLNIQIDSNSPRMRHILSARIARDKFISGDSLSISTRPGKEYVSKLKIFSINQNKMSVNKIDISEFLSSSGSGSNVKTRPWEVLLSGNPIQILFVLILNCF